MVAWEPHANALTSAIASYPDASSKPFQMTAVVCINLAGRDGAELKFDHSSVAWVSALEPEYQVCVAVVSHIIASLLDFHAH